MNHLLLISFLFVLGACIGSFLNVVVWRLPRNQSLVSPPSHCPKCRHALAWYDNIPVLGWILLRGRCRYCQEAISPRYPIVEAVTGGLFVLYYVAIFMLHLGPAFSHFDVDGMPTGRTPLGPVQEGWPIYALYMVLVSALLAASLIDAELFIIPVEIPWLLAVAGVVGHALIADPALPGWLSADGPAAALAIGGGIGLLVSVILFLLGKMPTSFPQGEPMLEVDRPAAEAEMEKARREGREPSHLPPPYTRRQIIAEIRKEMLFLLPPLAGALVTLVLWQRGLPMPSAAWIQGGLGAVLGALVGGLVVWITRILGTLGFGRVAMGLGDVHLMFGVGAIIGAGPVTAAFFLAPFFGILVAAYMLLTRTRRELPYGPYLSLATGFVLLYYPAVYEYLAPGFKGLLFLLHRLFEG